MSLLARSVCIVVLAFLATAVFPGSVATQVPVPVDVSGPRASITSASAITLPGGVDSNSPAIWSLNAGVSQFTVMTSTHGSPSLANGSALTRLGSAQKVEFTDDPGNGVWMEAVVEDDQGTWYGYYHNENPAVVCGRPDRAIARIGAARSFDQGRTWDDLGVVLEAATDTYACDSPNRYVIGGVGDLSVMLNAAKTDLYFFFSQYPKQQAAQGVAVARLVWANRDRPTGRVMVWTDGVWMASRIKRTPTVDVFGNTRQIWREYPAGTPLAPTTQAWHDGDGKVDAFWGPSVHWNEGIEQYVMLLNRAKDESYSQAGIYVSYAPRLDDPRLWTAPQKLMTGGRWYPQVMGLTPGSGTDKVAGATARLFLGGRSDWIISFSR
ncbi:MAG: hypothetical protein ABI665_22100 [Vicinamibacterales bacterium]